MVPSAFSAVVLAAGTSTRTGGRSGPGDPGHDRCVVDLDTPDDRARLLERLPLPAADAALTG